MTDQKQPTEKAFPNAQMKRHHWLRISFMVFVILPTLLGTIYTTFITSDRYVTEMGFAVRTLKSANSLDMLGAFTGLTGGGSTTSESHMILKFIESRDVLDRLKQDFPFRESYGAQSVDPISRLRPNQTIEKELKYWKRRINASFDPTSGIIDLDVQGFSAEESHQVAELVMSYLQELVDGFSAQARRDAASYAEQEVTRTEIRQLAALEKIRIFRYKNAALDPAASAGAQIEILAELEIRLLSIQTRMASLENKLDDDSPSMSALHRQAEALEAQIISKGGGSIVGNKTELTELLAEYEELLVEKEFARKIYASALVALERARVEAGRQQRYLAVYNKPSLAEHPLYPRKILYPFLFLAISIGLWGIGTLMVYSIRDHIA